MELSKDRIHISLYISVEGEIAHKLSEIESGDKIIQVLYSTFS
ncbi:22065_t:CDS:2 [Rhizophagus irregularis]|nr:22065_t:CDS:2 [Rhizophagus irregularis]